MAYFISFTAIALALSFLLPSKAHAYVDPGVGGMLYQILILAGAVVLGAFATFRNKIKTLFGSKKGNPGQGDSGAGRSGDDPGKQS